MTSPGRVRACLDVLRFGSRQGRRSLSGALDVIDAALFALDGLHRPGVVDRGAQRAGKVRIDFDDGESIEFRSDDLCAVAHRDTAIDEEWDPEYGERSVIRRSHLFVTLMCSTDPDEQGVQMRCTLPRQLDAEPSP